MKNGCIQCILNKISLILFLKHYVTMKYHEILIPTANASTDTTTRSTILFGHGSSVHREAVGIVSFAMNL